MDTITSRTNERVKEISALCSDASLRYEKGACVLFGAKLCGEALRLGAKLNEVWFTKSANESCYSLSELIENAEKTVLMSDGVEEKLAYLKTPTGVLAVAKIPVSGENQSAKRRVILSAVQDPANVGAIIRTAAALGIEEVVLSGDCADAFSPKALRASMGAAFAVGIRTCNRVEDEIQTLQEKGVLCVATALSKNSVPISEIDKSKSIALIIGNEGSGLSDAIIGRCDVSAIIPITDRVESLNAASASAIAMWELRI